MKNKIIFITLLLIGVFVRKVNAQQEAVSILEFEIYDQIEDSCKIFLRINTDQAKFIEFKFYEEGHIIFNQEAILNKKKDGNFYLLFMGNEKEVFLDDIIIETKIPHIKASPKSKFIEVKLFDKDFTLITESRKQI
ncbi:hypothetical protein Q4566_16235 [Tamlana sp. 2_MG-2023]|uniref:hypothetical protein n=1 Tax=unclassified Tamlana TaxID=2614803 RepID=UPI0026E31E34|nr:MULTISPECIES: hypothetical protein [unclassified Tamlana]MDO6761758.1 hypothetical protein [Tamlana sp. 2_MG-2023]MDO6792519.1 hypothetical protein [Tamlana sp. 1_MG-2023]